MLLLQLLGLYLAVGVTFALAFIFRGAGAVDPAAREGTWGFRLLIFPGAVVFWPWLGLRWKAALANKGGVR